MNVCLSWINRILFNNNLLFSCITNRLCHTLANNQNHISLKRSQCTFVESSSTSFDSDSHEILMKSNNIKNMSSNDSSSNTEEDYNEERRRVFKNRASRYALNVINFAMIKFR